jgi:class I fructose-bisphosphate aldolase
MDAGGTGLAVGRNVWQRENPEELLDALEDVIYEGKSVDAVV